MGVRRFSYQFACVGSSRKPILPLLQYPSGFQDGHPLRGTPLCPGQGQPAGSCIFLKASIGKRAVSSRIPYEGHSRRATGRCRCRVTHPLLLSRLLPAQVSGPSRLDLSVSTCTRSPSNNLVLPFPGYKRRGPLFCNTRNKTKVRLGMLRRSI